MSGHLSDLWTFLIRSFGLGIMTGKCSWMLLFKTESSRVTQSLYFWCPRKRSEWMTAIGSWYLIPACSKSCQGFVSPELLLWVETPSLFDWRLVVAGLAACFIVKIEVQSDVFITVTGYMCKLLPWRRKWITNIALVPWSTNTSVTYRTVNLAMTPYDLLINFVVSSVLSRFRGFSIGAPSRGKI